MTQRPVALRDFRSLAPAYRGEQERAMQWLAAAHARSELTAHADLPPHEREERARRAQRRVLHFGAATERIRHRQSAVADFTHTEWAKMRIYPLHASPAGAGCTERSLLFAEVVNDAFQRFYAAGEPPPAALLHVTCTGYVSPSGAQLLAARRGWLTDTEVIHLYHMGCYAALPGIRVAAGLAAAGRSRVDLVHTELCTLHLDPRDHSAEQLIAQMLFADGLIRYSLVPESEAARGPRLLLCAAREQLVPDSEADMTWSLSDHGMQITLSRQVPERIRPVVGDFIQALAGKADLRAEELRERAIFAVHPGGPRIIDQVGEVLGLREPQLAASNAILAAYGNMSSATLPHIWQAILDDAAVPSGTPVVSLAFGPGLTISGAILRKEI
jgi:predicted naringenin-chalcone synthase